jgi:hypothetical protein
MNEDSYVQMAPLSIISCTDLGSVGQVMSITKQNFENVDECTVKIAGYICPRPSLREMHSRIACQILEGKESKLAVQVCVAGQWSKVGGPATMFSYKGNVSFASRNPAHSLLIELTIFLKLTRSRLLMNSTGPQVHDSTDCSFEDETRDQGGGLDPFTRASGFNSAVNLSLLSHLFYLFCFYSSGSSKAESPSAIRCFSYPRSGK